MTTDDPAARAASEARGRTQGYATAALAAACVAFINLLGAEKALLALFLAGLALRGAPTRAVRRRAWFAVGLGALHLVTVVAVLLLFHDQLHRLILLLKDLG